MSIEKQNGIVLVLYLAFYSVFFIHNKNQQTVESQNASNHIDIIDKLCDLMIRFLAKYST